MVATTLTRQGEEREEKRRNCIHFWVINGAGSRTSEGTCKYCGERRHFSNIISDCARTSPDEYELWLSRQK